MVMISSEVLAPGSVLHGRYRIQQLLGKGAMGQVFEAHDCKLDRRVAVKVLLGAYSDSGLVERLFREARAAARPDHRGVVITYGHGSDPALDLTYLTMERLKGVDLRTYREQQKRLTDSELLQLGLELSDTLAAVHEVQVVHRDIKPSNVFRAERRNGRVEFKLLDFGIAKVFDMHPLTTTGQSFGTPAYMAPEYIADPAALDARCDLYSLGVVLYECATDELPYPAASMVELIKHHRFSREPDVRDKRPELPDVLAHVIHGCLKRDAAERIPTAQSVYDVLAR